MDNVTPIHSKKTAKECLENFVKEDGDNISNFLIFAVDKNGDHMIAGSNLSKEFTSVISVLAQDLAYKSVVGLIESE